MKLDTITIAAATSAAVLRAAMLQPGDVPGATTLGDPPDQTAAGWDVPTGDAGTDMSRCFPGNPLGVAPYPSEVTGPDLAVIDGQVRRLYDSSAKLATPVQARDFVVAFGSSCVINAIRAGFAASPMPVDASAIRSAASTFTVGDGGSVLTIDVAAQGSFSAYTIEYMVFSKGNVAVAMSVSAFGAPVIPGQGLDLAQRIATRLP